MSRQSQAPGPRPGPGPGAGPVANVEVGAAAVPAATRRAAHAALSLAQRLLPFLPPLTVRWFREAEGAAEQGDASLAMLGRLLGALDEGDVQFDGFLSAHPVAGLAFAADETTIWLRAALPPRDAAYTTLHEARHRAQTLANRRRSGAGATASPRPLTTERRAALEQDADEWAAAHVGEVL